MASSATSVTQELADFVAGLTLDTLPCDVREQVRLVLVDFFRAGIVGTNTSWGAKLRPVMLGLGGTPTSSILYSDERLDPVRAAYINAIIAGSLEWDDTHVGAMHHPGVCIWPSVLALAEKIGAKANVHAIKPFISQEPLPYNLSSLIVALKGSVDQPLETGTTSV